jgi:hypothetical protein
MSTFVSRNTCQKLIIKNNLRGIAATSALFAGLCGATGVYAQAVVETGTFIASDQFYRTIDKDMAKITFDKGSADLSNESFATLTDFVKKANSESKVDSFIVATWADEAYPTKGELSHKKRELAESRSENIKKGLSAKGITNVDFFEMTKRPNWFQRVFSTKTAEIKNKGSNSTPHERLLKEIGQKLREQGGPRTAVIVAKFKNEILSE